jgi:hypothetical protein
VIVPEKTIAVIPIKSENNLEFDMKDLHLFLNPLQTKKGDWFENSRGWPGFPCECEERRSENATTN